MAKKTTTKTADATRLPSIAVLERRLQSPFGEGSPAVTLKQPGWTLRVVNANLRPGRYHDVTRNKGWVPVEATEIDGDPLDFGFDIKDGRVVRGERGQEVLMKMPSADYQKILMAKDAYNKRLVGGKAVKAATVERAAKEHGDEAADMIDRSITFKTTRAPVPTDEALENEPD